MKRNDIIRRSVYIIREYYKGNLSPFFESIDENSLDRTQRQSDSYIPAGNPGSLGNPEKPPTALHHEQHISQSGRSGSPRL